MKTIDSTYLPANYDALFIDAYGVLVDAHGALPDAPKFVRYLNEQSLPFAIVTNDASTSLERISERFARLDMRIDPGRIVSSASLLTHWVQATGLEGASVAVLGPDDAHEFVRAAGARTCQVTEAPTSGTRALIVCDIGPTLYEDLTAAVNLAIRAIDSGEAFHLVLCNPDVIYPAGGGFGITSGAAMLVIEGALKSRYQAADVPTITKLGKPYPAIYAAARTITKGKRLALLGDQLPTDIRGALDYGIDAILVGTGLTKVQPNKALLPSPTHYLPAVGQGLP